MSPVKQPAPARMSRGYLVTFEGIDGCGKSTQALLFCRYLKAKKIPVILLQEPGGTFIGQRIRRLLLHQRKPLTPWCELFLYLASRAQLVEEKVKPALLSGKVVVLDRHTDSTLAYQGYGRKLPLSFIRAAHACFLKRVRPDLTFLIDASAEKLSGILSAKGRDRMEQETLAFQKSVRRGYLHLARHEKKRIRVIPRESIAETSEKIIREWESFCQKEVSSPAKSEKQ